MTQALSPLLNCSKDFASCPIETSRTRPAWCPAQLAGATACTQSPTRSGRFAVRAAKTRTSVHGPVKVSACPLTRNRTNRCRATSAFSKPGRTAQALRQPTAQCVAPENPRSNANIFNTGIVPGSTGDTVTGSCCQLQACPSRICNSPRQADTLQKFKRASACG